ncbi:MAG: hypothetical protein ACI9KE_004751 [Polyangiales bacterium]|jgi:hypothetical protein
MKADAFSLAVQLQEKEPIMLTVIQETNRNLLLVEPRGPLSKNDVVDLGKRIDGFINEEDALPSLVIHAKSFRGWKNVGALTHHLKLVRDRHRLIAKVAIVSDGSAMTILPKIADQFVSAKLQHFSEDRLEEAKSWAANSAKDLGTVEWFDDLPDDVLGFRAVGTLTAGVYERDIIPAIETRLATHAHLKLLVQLGPEFEGYTAGAAWDDAKVGLMHMGDFTRVAIVTNVEGFRTASTLFAPLMKGEVHVFANSELPIAKEWIKA